jgi:hypothetical protein
MERVFESQWCEQCRYEQHDDYQCPCGKDQLHPECPWYQDALWAALEDPCSGVEWVEQAVTAERELEKIEEVLERVAELTGESYYGESSLPTWERVMWIGASVVLQHEKEEKECQQK